MGPRPRRPHPAQYHNRNNSPHDEHTVQFYDTDDVLVEALSDFIHNALGAAEACVIIATRARHGRLNRRLRARGLDLAEARRRGQYIAMDADRMLATFMENGHPDPARFEQAARRVIGRATQGGRRARVFGEMVARLWLQGQRVAAIELEALWNDLQRQDNLPFTLLCAYPIQAFADETQGSDLATIQQQHSSLALTEGSVTATSPEERMRALIRLQQQAHMLRVEMSRRQLIEERLRISERRYRRLFEGSLDGILLVDPQTGRIEAANPAAVEMLGGAAGARQELAGRELWRTGLFPNQEAAGRALDMLRERRAARYPALELPANSGARRMVDAVYSYTESDGPPFIQCTLHDVTEREELAHNVAERTQELEALQAITDVALAQPSLDALLRELLERTRAVLQVDNVAILLPDAAERELHIHLARGPEEEVAGQVRVPIGQGVAGTIAATRRLMVIDDLRAVPVANPFLHKRLRSLMGTPLLAEDRLIGVIHVATERPHHFTEREARLLHLVAERVALAIERAQLRTAARHARQETQDRAHLLQATFGAIADGVLVCDYAGHVLQMNAAAQQMLGYGAALEYETTIVDMGRHETRNASGQPLLLHERPMSRVLRGEVLTGGQTADVIIQSVDGQERELSVTGAPMRDAAGNVLGGVCVFRDVTAQRRLERRTHEALGALLAMAAALVDLPEEMEQKAGKAEQGAHAADANYSATTPVAYRLAQLVRDVMDCKRVGILAVEPENKVQEPIAAVGLEPEMDLAWRRERLARQQPYGEGLSAAALDSLADGKSVVIDMTQPPYDMLPNPHGMTTTLLAPMRVGARLVGILALDYAGERHDFAGHERALAEAVAQLVALVFERDRLLGEREDARAAVLAAQETAQRMNTFLGIAGHELRTPVTSIKMGVQLSRQALRKLAGAPIPADTARTLERAVALLQRADEQSNRLNRLIEDILDVTRTQSGTLSLHAVASDLVAVARRAVEGQRLAWPDREIGLEALEAPLWLTMDPDRIEQVVTNLLTNALKYSSADQPVAVRVSADSQMARVSVRDHGPGLTPEMQARLWEPFHQVEGIRQQSGSGVGLGLGLYICRTLVERHGGRLGVESTPGEGSTFWFELPRTHTPSEPADGADNAREAQDASGIRGEDVSGAARVGK